jgi:hypothetical protein
VRIIRQSYAVLRLDYHVIPVRYSNFGDSIGVGRDRLCVVTLVEVILDFRSDERFAEQGDSHLQLADGSDRATISRG